MPGNNQKKKKKKKGDIERMIKMCTQLFIFYSAVQILYEIVESYHQRQIEVYFVRLRERPLEMFERSGLLKLIGGDHQLRKLSDAIEAVERDMTKQNVIVQ
jgi:MFS superfamily sulfate permease-like transporter